MAWYRAGGGGIPSSLKTGMNNVLNKKFGTSTTYDPAGWPDNVNLLGPLPEKTVSGAIASFADGADDVPLKSCAVTIAPNLDGVSSVDVVHAHKSLINFVGNVRTTTSAGLTMEATTSGGIRMHGTTTLTYAYLTSRFDCFLKAGATYTFSRDVAKGYRLLLNCTYADDTTGTQAISANATSRTFTPEKDIVQIRLETANMANNTAYDDTILVMVETGATATDFVKYEAPDTHTANLGRTIYGGSVDVVQGTGTDGFAKFACKWGDYVASADFTNVTRRRFDLPSAVDVDNRDKSICNVADWVENYSQDTVHFYVNNQNRAYVFLPIGTSDDTDIIIVYPKATPEDFTFTPTPINSFLGDNNIWNDAGDTEVTYRADIALALGGGS